MSDIIPSIKAENLIKIMQEGRVSELQSCEVTFEGQAKATLIVYHGDMDASDNIKVKASYLGMKSNISGGVVPQDMFVDKYPALTKAREARKAKREAALASV